MIIVTGDLVREVHFYKGSRTYASQAPADGTREMVQMGGAALLHELLLKIEPGSSILGLKVDETQPWPEHLTAYASYTAHLAGFRDDPKPPRGAKPKKVWRISAPGGYGFDDAVPPPEPPATRELPETGTVLVIDDGGAGFRTQRAKSRWPDGGDVSQALPPWLVFKTSRPCSDGYLWRHLVERCRRSSGNSQLVVIVSADELRRDGAAITRGLSWERTTSDTCRAFAHSPQLAGAQMAAHVIVVFRREGALWLQPSKKKATLVFDPELAEGQWKSTLNEQGTVFGHLSVFTAAIALELARRRDTVAFDAGIVGAIRTGLAATRELCLSGHGPVEKGKKPGFPFEQVANVLRGTAEARKDYQPQDTFVAVDVPVASLVDSTAPAWTIASQNDPPGASPTPQYGLAFQTAIYGPKRLSSMPQARFGDLLTVDRDEIEKLRALRQMIQAYEEGGRQKQPLCLGAFGPPGSGKSFGIKQIAAEVFGSDVTLLEFNLSQFSKPEDLIGAFHQVRDKVLAGVTPVVFWDEFDSGEFRWLQLLLAPMQDGKFQSGQLTHTLGKCVFVFAGATSWDFEHFGPAPSPTNAAETKALGEILMDAFVRNARTKAEEEFRLKKGPDFVSRLNGHINVLGPNRRLLYNFATGTWDQPDVTDITFPVRRALLLRSFVKAKHGDVLDPDRDLLNALIRQPRYKHGARSMEKIVEPLRATHAPLRLAQLPAPQVLTQHLDTAEAFQSLLVENGNFLTSKHLHDLAAAIHENYRLTTEPQYVHDPQFLNAYDALDAWGRATNLAAAARIPYVLAMAGLCVREDATTEAEEKLATELLRRCLDPLRREEHSRWEHYLSGNGWLQSPTGIRDNAQLLHKCLLPFDKLSEPDQKKDDRAIMSLPQAVALLNFKIVLFPDPL
jgi:ATPase family associated with various cellular activities (AAA)